MLFFLSIDTMVPLRICSCLDQWLCGLLSPLLPLAFSERKIEDLLLRFAEVLVIKVILHLLTFYEGWRASSGSCFLGG